MNFSKFLELKKGDQVVYTGNHPSGFYGIKKGHILTRSESWMDDELSALFDYTTESGNHYHFFGYEDIEVKE